MEGTSEVARFAKIMRYQPKYAIGLLRKSDGSFTQTPEETIELLSCNSFPGSTLARSEDERKRLLANASRAKGAFRANQAEWRSLNRIKDAIKTFSPMKAAGPDDIKPIILQNLPDSYLERLGKLFDAVITAGYNPTTWRKARVVYISKAGKDSYDSPKSFRPISLTPFIFKTLERLVHWHLLETTLNKNPFNDNQHAFRTNRGTEMALHQAITEIEKGTIRGNYALGVFLDVSAAFDKLSFKAARKAMKKKGIPPEIADWYQQYLENRISIIELKGHVKEIEIKSGTPQGGILSVILWNLAFDLLLKKLSNKQVKIIGFADDGALIIHGKNLRYMTKQMQKAVNEAAKWASENGLKLSTEKTVAILFTRKRKAVDTDTIPITLDGTNLTYVEEVKYLGITLDAKMTFKHHIDNKIKQAKKYLFAIRSSIGSTWGPAPDKMIWIWETVIRPAITYGSLVWATYLTPAMTKRLNKVQRLALTTTGHYRRSTQETGLDVAMGILPLDLHILASALKGWNRTKGKYDPKWSGNGPNGKRSHFKKLEDLTKEAGLIFETDKGDTQYSWENNFEIDLESLQEGIDLETGTRIYTDGSKMEDETGYGAVMLDNERIQSTINGKLNDEATVFQAESMAITKALELLDQDTSSVTILTDSQVLVKSLAAYKDKKKH